MSQCRQTQLQVSPLPLRRLSVDAEDDMGHFTTDEDDDAFSRFRMTIHLFFVACNFLRISFIRLVAEARRVRENGGI